MRSTELYLDDIVAACDAIASYTSRVRDAESFEADSLTRDAVRARFIDIGEAASKIPDDLKSKFSEVDWRRVVGMRNVLAHEYFGVRYEVIWLSVVEFLPELRRTALLMLQYLAQSDTD